MAGTEILQNRIGVNPDAIAAFCRKWGIRELSLFGSVLTDDFRPDSDVDVLITFADPQRDLGPWGRDLETMRDELESMFGRRVDLVEKRLVRNPFRRHHILTNRTVIYAA
jgi:predicted nucleotidyltransferase